MPLSHTHSTPTPTLCNTHTHTHPHTHHTHSTPPPPATHTHGPMPTLFTSTHRYTLVASAGVYAGVFLYRNSRLSGSPNLDNWFASGAGAVQGAWTNHVITPLITVRDELFRTFRE